MDIFGIGSSFRSISNIIISVFGITIFIIIFYFYYNYQKLKENNVILKRDNAILLIEKEKYEKLRELQNIYIKEISMLNEENYKKDIIIKKKFNNKEIMCNVPDFKKEYNNIVKK